MAENKDLSAPNLRKYAPKLITTEEEVKRVGLSFERFYDLEDEEGEDSWTNRIPFNWADVGYDPEDNLLTFAVSLNDPRGADMIVYFNVKTQKITVSKKGKETDIE